MASSFKVEQRLASSFTLGRLSYINYLQLTQDQLLDILRIRNHPANRHWLYTDHIISEQEHFSFVENLKSRAGKAYWGVFSEDRNLVGSFNTTIKDSGASAMVGLLVNPATHGKGYGKRICRYTLPLHFEYLHIPKIYSEVFVENQASLKAFKRAGFTEENIIDKEIANQHHSGKVKVLSVSQRSWQQPETEDLTITPFKNFS